MTEIIAQIISIAAMALNIFSYQCKKDRHLLLMMGGSSIMFAISFMLLGSSVSAGYNLINVVRFAAILNKRTRSDFMFWLICIAYTLVGVLAYDGPWGIALLASQYIGTYATWYRGGAFIRKAQFFVLSPIWLINNSLIVFSVGGILCESFAIVSVIVSFIRYGKNGFEA